MSCFYSLKLGSSISTHKLVRSSLSTAGDQWSDFHNTNLDPHVQHPNFLLSHSPQTRQAGWHHLWQVKVVGDSDLHLVTAKTTGNLKQQPLGCSVATLTTGNTVLPVSHHARAVWTRRSAAATARLASSAPDAADFGVTSTVHQTHSGLSGDSLGPWFALWVPFQWCYAQTPGKESAFLSSLRYWEKKGFCIPWMIRGNPKCDPKHYLKTAMYLDYQDSPHIYILELNIYPNIC